MFVGVNDEEALRCLEKAKACLQKGDRQTAERFAKKALRMFSSTDKAGRAAAEALLKRLYSQDPQGKTSHFAPSNESKASRRRGAEPPSEEAQAGPEYDKNTEAKCRAILASKDYYKILGVEKNCSAEDVKRAYRKLALQLHPDKAKCPSAEAAFKELSKAYQCLSDREARQFYDAHGREEDAAQQQQYRQHYESHFMTPEELFESFFGLQFRRGPYTYQRVFHTARGHGPQQGNAGLLEQGILKNNKKTTAVYPGRNRTAAAHLAQFFPLIVLLLITVISSLLNSPASPEFSLSRSHEYSEPRWTSENRIPYYVRTSFDRAYRNDPRHVRDLEIQIELSHFSGECYKEQQRALQKLSQVKYYGSGIAGGGKSSARRARARSVEPAHSTLPPASSLCLPAAQYRKQAEEYRENARNGENCRQYRTLKIKYPAQAHQLYRQSDGTWF